MVYLGPSLLLVGHRSGPHGPQANVLSSVLSARRPHGACFVQQLLQRRCPGGRVQLMNRAVQPEQGQKVTIVYKAVWGELK